MPTLPRVVGLVLCRRMEVDLPTHQTSLVGLFNALTFSTFPAAAAFTVYAVLYGGKGEGTMKLRVTRLETEEDIYSHERWWTLPGHGLNVHVEIKVRKCAFPGPGRYALSLRFDGQELTSRYLEVFRSGGPE
jgi:hypothetical protein